MLTLSAVRQTANFPAEDYLPAIASTLLLTLF